jgi:flagellar hook-basal body complex protein FliE
MADPLGFISGNAGHAGSVSGVGAPRPRPTSADARGQAPGESFKDVLMQNLREVNEAQQEATRAVEDLQTGKRTDVEGVILATQKADTAFRMLQQLRNRVMEAYDEVKQMRV